MTTNPFYSQSDAVSNALDTVERLITSVASDCRFINGVEIRPDKNIDAARFDFFNAIKRLNEIQPTNSDQTEKIKTLRLRLQGLKKNLPSPCERRISDMTEFFKFWCGCWCCIPPISHRYSYSADSLSRSTQVTGFVVQQAARQQYIQYTQSVHYTP